ncbi:hypothetical protein [Sphingomonas nostoxanthinifaciens]|uniref:hypothetical protein n=1 Tax=Sphingomonas nostoxanthinifaciens TaxID=2872652 RepID=UPI001CC216E4|nr:hypothetical protein [Sphingomonas nostoxanthinifaciens]UAK24913.1 hypothetical protein K8P63_01465 [Sphingomonas nostoxanthinifaciens]
MTDSMAGTWGTVIDEMQAVERGLPHGEMWAVDAVYHLAVLVSGLTDHLPDEQRATLIHVGALIAREANRETMAALQADLVLRKVAPR